MTFDIKIDSESSRQLLARLGWTVEARLPGNRKGLIVHTLKDPDGNTVDRMQDALEKAILGEKVDIDTLELSLIPEANSNQAWRSAPPQPLSDEAIKWRDEWEQRAVDRYREREQEKREQRRAERRKQTG